MDSRGYDRGKKIKGKKRHILVNMLGLVLRAIVHPANSQDRDRGALLLATLFGRSAFLENLFVDGGCAGPVFRTAARKVIAKLNVEIVKRSDTAMGFKVLPKRCIVERTIAWLYRGCRLAKDLECLTRKALAFLRLASIRFILRKLCNPQ